MHYRRIPTTLLVGASIWLFLTNHVLAQTPPGLITISVGSGSSQAETEAAETLVARMLDDGELVLEGSHGDSQLPGRRHDGFGQLHNGVAVYGASISKQTMGGETVSIFGTIYTDIDVNLNPTLSLGDATTRMEGVSGVAAFQVTQPLTILPTLDGTYALAYRITASTLVTYFIDAHDGHVLMEVDQIKQQGAVGVGQGVLGDTKKVSATEARGRFEARDQLRPGDILTLATKGSTQRLDRLLNGRLLSSDIATDADNTWTNSGIVDTHVHMGWTYDYFFKQHSWAGLDGRNVTMHGVRGNSGLLLNNAFFAPPPFGPEGEGLVGFGTTRSGTPITTLDVVAHEMMHGVTHFGVSRRNAGGLSSSPFQFDSLGPSGALIDGRFIQCVDLIAVFPDGTLAPFACHVSAGQFVLAANHGGATGEAFSDVFGTATEFFFQNRGSGPLRADYLIGEDIPELGPVRALRRPASLFVDTTRTARYPDHYSRRLRFAMVVLEGFTFIPVSLAFNGERFFSLSSIDRSGEHWNSTILSHAFYLAIEAGRNPTSGVRVDGVGAANRDQIERVFFRAVTVLMPRFVSLPLVADVIRESARDLFGPGPVRRAVFEALRAVGL